MISFFTSLDQNLLLWIQEYIRTPFLNRLLIPVTTLGNAGILWIVLTLLLLFIPKYRKTGLACTFALLTGLIITNILLKNTVHRIRPYEVIEGLTILVSRPSDWSFPSGHATSSIAAGLVMFFTLPRKYGISALCLGILISLSRLYVGVHYPSDVLAGAIIGIFAAWTGLFLSKKVQQRKGAE